MDDDRPDSAVGCVLAVRKLKTRLAADVDRHRVHVRLCVPHTRRCISRPSLWDTPPNAFARDHGWWQVSWLAGRRLGPPSQGQSVPSGIHGLRLAAYSCGGSYGIASIQDAHRIPFYIPCGHHRQRCLHRAAGESRTSETTRAVRCAAAHQHKQTAAAPASACEDRSADWRARRRSGPVRNRWRRC
jgi:hypothetical protein